MHLKGYISANSAPGNDYLETGAERCRPGVFSEENTGSRLSSFARESFSTWTSGVRSSNAPLLNLVFKGRRDECCPLTASSVNKTNFKQACWLYRVYSRLVQLGTFRQGPTLDAVDELMPRVNNAKQRIIIIRVLAQNIYYTLVQVHVSIFISILSTKFGMSLAYGMFREETK